MAAAQTAPAAKAYVGLFNDNAVAVLDTGTNQVLSTIRVPGPHGIVITPDGRWVYVSSDGASTVSVIDTNEASNDLSVIDLGTQTVTATIPIGNAPRKVVVQQMTTATTAAAVDQ